MVLFILIIRVIILHTLKKNKRLNKSPITTTEALKLVLGFSFIMFLFGLTWLSGVFTFISEPAVSYIVQFLFAFCNAFQGFFIFLYLIILSGGLRNAWKSVFCSTIRNSSISETPSSNKYYHGGNKSREKKISTSSAISDTSVLHTNAHLERRELYKFNPTVTLEKLKENNEEEDSECFPIITASEKSEEEMRAKQLDTFLEQFGRFRFERHSTIRKKHHVEKIEIDFFHCNDDTDDLENEQEDEN